MTRESPNRVQTLLQFTDSVVGHSSFSTEPGIVAQTRQNTVETQQVQLLNNFVILTCKSLCNDGRRWSRHCSEVQQLQFIDKVVKMYVLTQRQIPVEVGYPCSAVPQAQVVQKTVALTKTQYIDRSVDVPAGDEERQVQTIQRIQKTVVTAQAQFIPVVMHDRCL